MTSQNKDRKFLKQVRNSGDLTNLGNMAATTAEGIGLRALETAKHLLTKNLKVTIVIVTII